MADNDRKATHPGISLIVAAAENNVIGDRGGLPWHLGEDLRRFKAVTMGKPMIMGRATWESIGRPLPGRRSIVLTRQAGYRAAGCAVVHSVADALAEAGDADEIMVVGGGDIYRQFLPLAKRIYLTRVHADVGGDTRFPDLDADDWQRVSREEFPVNAERQYGFSIEILDRR